MNEEIGAVSRKYSTESLLVVLFGAIALLVHFLTNGRYGYFRDELYYIACARHLAFGYVDQPPLSIPLLRLIQLLLEDSLFTIRLLPAVAGAAMVTLSGAVARALGGRACLLGFVLRAIQSCDWKFLFHERVRATDTSIRESTVIKALVVAAII